MGGEIEVETERKKEGQRGGEERQIDRDRHQSVVLLIYAFIG